MTTSTTAPTTPYSSFPNSFKRRLLAGERLIGCWCSLANPITTEVLGVAGFDWILLDGEHSPNDVISFIPQLMALKDSVSAISCGMKLITSFGECSPSSRIQSNPATPSTSVVIGFASEHQQPIRRSPASRRRLKLFGNDEYGVVGVVMVCALVLNRV